MVVGIFGLTLVTPIDAVGVYSEVEITAGRDYVHWGDFNSCELGHGIKSITNTYTSYDGTPGTDLPDFDQSGITALQFTCDDNQSQNVMTLGRSKNQKDTTKTIACTTGKMCGLSVAWQWSEHGFNSHNQHLVDHVGVFNLKPICCDDTAPYYHEQNTPSTAITRSGIGFKQFKCPKGHVLSGLRAQGVPAHDGVWDEYGIEGLAMRCQPATTDSSLQFGSNIDDTNEWAEKECKEGFIGIGIKYAATRGDEDDVAITAISGKCSDENTYKTLSDAIPSGSAAAASGTVKLREQIMECPTDMVVCGIENIYDDIGVPGHKKGTKDVGGVVVLNAICCTKDPKASPIKFHKFISGPQTAFSDCFAESSGWTGMCEGGFVSKLSSKAMPYQLDDNVDNRGVDAFRMTCSGEPTKPTVKPTANPVVPARPTPNPQPPSTTTTTSTTSSTSTSSSTETTTGTTTASSDNTTGYAVGGACAGIVAAIGAAGTAMYKKGFGPFGGKDENASSEEYDESESDDAKVNW